MTSVREPWLERMRSIPLFAFIALYTVVTGGPLLWVASMSLRTTAEIFRSPYGLPSPAHWEKFADAWTKSNYATHIHGAPLRPQDEVDLSLLYAFREQTRVSEQSTGSP